MAQPPRLGAALTFNAAPDVVTNAGMESALAVWTSRHEIVNMAISNIARIRYSLKNVLKFNFTKGNHLIENNNQLCCLEKSRKG